MIHAIGTGVGDEFDLSKARYHKIVIRPMPMSMVRIFVRYY